MNKKFAVAACIAMLTVSACAQRPDAIAPVSMAGAYDGVSCRSAQQLLAAERQNLSALSAQQNQAANGDALGVFLIGVPMSSVTGGDKAGDIASSKGKIVALENRMLRCG
ncbi:hypothetical protein [Sulfitobacter sp.]|uniref:hypothetical protein n=1 Tax=Sulfitobacter sp. TaxID=1903071 RepID=UPI00272D4DD4|nr:hypothetical protein [Sulfitobacter sp.]